MNSIRPVRLEAACRAAEKQIVHTAPPFGQADFEQLHSRLHDPCARELLTGADLTALLRGGASAQELAPLVCSRCSPLTASRLRVLWQERYTDPELTAMCRQYTEAAAQSPHPCRRLWYRILHSEDGAMTAAGRYVRQTLSLSESMAADGIEPDSPFGMQVQGAYYGLCSSAQLTADDTALCALLPVLSPAYRERLFDNLLHCFPLLQGSGTLRPDYDTLRRRFPMTVRSLVQEFPPQRADAQMLHALLVIGELPEKDAAFWLRFLEEHAGIGFRFYFRHDPQRRILLVHAASSRSIADCYADRTFYVLHGGQDKWPEFPDPATMYAASDKRVTRRYAGQDWHEMLGKVKM